MTKSACTRASLIPYPMIAAAVGGDPEAVNRVVRHYSGYIAALSTRTIYGPDGNSHRKNVKWSTEKGREYLMSVLKEDPLGSRSIDSVKLSDAKEWAIRMSEKGYAYKTISNWKRSLKAPSTRRLRMTASAKTRSTSP